MNIDFRYSVQLFRCFWTNDTFVIVQKTSRTKYRISYHDGSVAKNNISKREVKTLLWDYIYQRV